MVKQPSSRPEAIEQILRQRCGREFPGVTWEEMDAAVAASSVSEEEPNFECDQGTDKIVAEAVQFRSFHRWKLDSCSDEELIETFEEERLMYTAFLGNVDETILQEFTFFNRPESDADFDHWLKMYYWTPEEAVSLSFGKEPTRVNKASLALVVGFSSFVSKYHHRLDQVVRAIEAGQLLGQITQESPIRWTTRTGIECPKPLSRLASANSSPSTQEVPVLPDYENLNWEEIKLSFLKERLIEIEIRGKKTRHSAVVLGLLDKKTGSLNKLGIFLLGLARGLGDKSNPGDHKKTVSDLRRTLKQYFKIKTSPIILENKLGYRSRIKLEDKTKSGDKRAEERAERSMGSLDEIGPNVVPSTEGHASDGEYFFVDDKNDEATKFLSERLHGGPEE